MSTKWIAVLAVAAAAVLLAGGGYLLNERSQPPELPPDGLALYRALLEEIPEVVSQVPCVCCKKTLDWCYEGGCPPT